MGINLHGTTEVSCQGSWQDPAGAQGLLVTGGDKKHRCGGGSFDMSLLSP